MKYISLVLIGIFACNVAHAEPPVRANDRLHQVEEQLSEKKHQQDILDQQARDAAKNLSDLRERLVLGEL